MGNAMEGSALSDMYSIKVPIWLDVGYRFTRNISAGIFFEYAFASINTDKQTGCNSAGVSCSGHTLRFGAEGIYTFNPQASFSPWAGIGLGFESAHVSASGNGLDSGVTASGFEFVNLQLGGDFKLSPKFSLGPHATFSFAHYGSLSMNGQSIDNFNGGTHGWLELGVRGKIDL